MQGSKSGSRDAGREPRLPADARWTVSSLVARFFAKMVFQRRTSIVKTQIELPGWYRPEKKWDLLIVEDGQFLAGIEFKSQVGSFGNNYNNRTEEAIGSASDLWAAYREGAFKPSARPWLGYMMLLEDARAPRVPFGPQEPHFKVFPEFKSSLICEAIRDPPDKTRARAAIRLGLFSTFGFEEWPRGNTRSRRLS